MLPNPQFPADLVTFTEEIIDGNLHFLPIDWVIKRKVNQERGNTESSYMRHFTCGYATQYQAAGKIEGGEKAPSKGS